MSIPNLTYKIGIPLKYNEDCNLLGVTPDLKLYIEEIYSHDAWIAQHIYQLDGSHLAIIDEDFGKNTSLSPLQLPANLVRPKPGWHTMDLNFTGPRHRGLRGPERIADMVKPLSIQSKIALVERFGLPVSPPLILGLAESYVISEIELIRPHLYFVCRRLRVAYALPQSEIDSEGETYDYDTQVIYLAHFYDKNQTFDPQIEDLIDPFPGINLVRPMDCLFYENHLFIADGGNTNAKSTIHVWEIDLSTLNFSKSTDAPYF